MADFRYYQFDDFLLDTEEGVLYRDGEPVQLTRKVFDLLLLLVRSGGRVLNHDEIINTLWADTAVEQANLKQSIYVLRRALGELPEENRFIKTLPKRGYRFLAEVRARPDETRSLIAAEHTVTDVFIEEEIIEDDAGELKERALLPPAPKRPVWQNPWLFALLGLIVFSTFGYGVYRFASAKNAALSPVSLENASWQKLTNSGDVHYAVISPNGEFVAYVGLHDDSAQSIRILNVGNRSELTVVPPSFVAIWGVAFSPDSSQIYYTVWDSKADARAARLYAVSVFGGTPRKILEPINGPLSFSPDGRRIAYVRHCEDSREICLVTANASDGGDQQTVARTQKSEFITPAFSPDGERIAYIGGENREDGWYWYLAEVPASGGEARRITEPRQGRFFGANWFPDGKGIFLNAAATDSKLQQLWYVSYPSGEITRITNDLIGYNFGGVSGDGKKIVSVQQTRTNSLWTMPIPESNMPSVPRRLTEDTLLIQSMTWTPDDRVVFDSFDNGRTHLWMMNADGSNRHQISPENVEDYRAAVSPDGKLMIFLSNRSGAWQLWRSALDGSEAKQLTFGKDSPRLGKFAFGGTKIIFEYFFNNQWRLVQTSVDGGEMTPVTDASPGFWAVSPDGKSVAYSFSDPAKKRNRIAVQSLEDKAKVIYLEINPRDILIFSPDGKSLLTKPLADVTNSISSLYSYPIAGGEPKKIVSNPPENFYWADFSTDGKKLAWVQGKIVSNVVLLTRKN